MIKLIHGDIFDNFDQIDDNSIDLIILDPPYLTTSEKWDKKEIVNNILVEQLFKKAKDSCSLYIWCGIGEKSQSLIRWFPLFSKLFYFKDLITWKKQRGIGMRKGWLYTREEIMWLVKDNSKFVWNKSYQYSTEKYDELWAKRLKKEDFPYKRATNVWTDIKEETLSGICGIKDIDKKDILHFTPKPLLAMERIIKVSSNENDLVLDCFMGSGATGVVCKKLNRNFIGVEIHKDYYELSKKRIEECPVSI